MIGSRVYYSSTGKNVWVEIRMGSGELFSRHQENIELLILRECILDKRPVIVIEGVINDFLDHY